MALPSLLPLVPDSLRTLLAERRQPCVSLFLPLHRPPADTGDPVVLRHLVDHACLSLAATRARDACERIVGPFREFEDADTFRREVAETSPGIAGFAAGGDAWVVPLAGPVEPAVRVGPRFHVLPLLRQLGLTERCRVVAVGSRLVRVCDAVAPAEGAARLAPTALAADGRVFADGSVPRDAIVALETEEPHRVMHGQGSLGDAVHGGFGSRDEGIDADTHRFLHDVGRMVAACPAAPGTRTLLVGSPRAVAALVTGLPRTHPLMAEVSIDPQRLGDAELSHIVGEALRVERRRREGALAESYQESRARGRGSSDFAEVARAAAAGRVGELLLEEGRHEPGSIDPRTGAISFPDSPVEAVAADADDLYGSLAEIVLAHGGEVALVSAERMPTRTGIAARYRWGDGTGRPPGGASGLLPRAARRAFGE